MRLTRVFIENFRGIRRLNLKLDLVTVLIGENSHSKTSIFDALCVCLGRPGSAERGQESVPPILRRAIETAVTLARTAKPDYTG